MFSAKVILDSLNPFNGIRLITMELTYPRFIHAEFMTHRNFSRNSASSRAIPVEQTIQMVMENPAIPIFWGKKQKGMSSDSQVEDIDGARREWLVGRDRAVETARSMQRLGLHKQLTNRVLEPFLWHTVICTATEWSNFFALRDHPDAQPEIAHLARLMKIAQNESVPTSRIEHMPYITSDDIEDAQRFVLDNWSTETQLGTDYNLALRQISAARCARVSYLTHDGKRDVSKDVELFERLVNGSGGSGHWSPLEHVAFANGEQLPYKDQYSGTWKIGPAWFGNFRGWKQFRKKFSSECK